MDHDDNSVLLLGYRSSSPKPHGRKRRNKHSIGGDDCDEEGAFRMHLSDSELSQKKEAEVERSTVFSDVLSDSLPSVRAHLAASQMLSRTFRRDQIESSLNERRPLLTSNDNHGTEGMIGNGNGIIEPDSKTPEIHQAQQTEPKYNTMRLVMKRRNKKVQLLLW